MMMNYSLCPRKNVNCRPVALPPGKIINFKNAFDALTWLCLDDFVDLVHAVERRSPLEQSPTRRVCWQLKEYSRILFSIKFPSFDIKYKFSYVFQELLRHGVLPEVEAII